MPAAKPIVYVETTIFSYLVARPSRDLLVAARQSVTAEWWRHAPSRFSLAVSAAVIREVSAGDPAVAAARNALLADLPVLEAPPEAADLAEHLLRRGVVPAKAVTDAEHIAIAAAAGATYLVTWNMRHLAGVEVGRRIEGALRARGYEPPLLCTPDALNPLPPPGGPDA